MIGLTGAEAPEFKVSVFEREFVSALVTFIGKRILHEEFVADVVGKSLGAVVYCEVRCQVGAQRAEFSFRTGIYTQLEAGALVPSPSSSWTSSM